jgi:CheY-like chemotaxis protein
MFGWALFGPAIIDAQIEVISVIVLEMTAEEFTQHIRFALQHLYEISVLDKGPARALTPWLDQAAESSESISSGQRLHRLLVRTIERMKPAGPLDTNLPRHRSYLILKRRYLDGIGIQQLENEFNTSGRQFRRESHRALEELVVTLWNLSPQPAQSFGPEAMSAPAPTPATTAATGDENAGEGLLARFDRSVSAINLLDVVVDAAQTLSVIISGAQTQIVADFPAELPAVSADRVALRLALIKLLRVAIAHSPQRTLTLRAHPEPPSSAIILSVDGVAGIDSGDSTLNEAAQLFALAEGQLRLAGDESSDEPGDPAAQQLVATLSMHRVPAVLVIDDDPAMPRIIQRFLALQPIRVVSCDSTSDVVNVAREAQPVLILLDVLMPKRDGWEILQELKAHPDTYHIHLAVCSIWDERELALSLGADTFFQKPISRAELLACVERHIVACGVSLVPVAPNSARPPVRSAGTSPSGVDPTPRAG